MPFQVKVKLLKEMYHVDLDVDAPPIEFGKAVEAETGVPPGSQRMKLKGKMLKPGEMAEWGDHKDNLVEGALFMIMQ